MTKNILFSVCTYIFVLMILLIGVFINDIKNNSLSLTDVNENSANFVSNEQSDIIHFQASNNYLGTVSLPISVPEKARIVFRIKEEHANNWFYEASYSGRFVANLSPFPFGFGIINNSFQKNYIVEVKTITPHQKLALQSEKIYSRYVFNKTLLLQNKSIALHFLLSKLLSLLSLLYIWFGALGITILVIFLRSSSKTRTISQVAGQINFEKNWLIYLTSIIIVLCYPSVMNVLMVIPIGVYVYMTIRYKSKKYSSFLIPALILLEITFFLMVHTSANIVYLLPFLLVFFIVSLVQELLNVFVDKEHIIRWYVTAYHYLSSLQPRKTIIVIGACILFVVLLMAIFNGTYYLGGDDSKLYFLYPKEYFTNLVSKVGPDSAASDLRGWLPPISIAPFVLMFLVLKVLMPFLNLQVLAYSLNIIGGFVFFYILLNYLLIKKGKVYICIKILGSLMYIFSIFDFYTLFNSQLIANFLLSTFPLSVYLYIRGIREKKLYFIVSIALLWSVFAYFTSALPWFAGAVIALLPVLVLELKQFLKRTIVYALVLGLLIVLLNIYWLTTLSYSRVVSTDSKQNTSSISSTSFREENAKGIQVVSGTNTVFYPLVNLYQYDIQNNFKWPYLPIFTSWYLQLLPLNVLFLLIILFAGKLLKGTDTLKSIYITGVASFLIAVYLYTVNIGKWGISLFITLNNYIPGFVMFRNMYDKLGFAIAFTLALAFTVSLVLVIERIHGQIKKFGILLAFLIILALNAKPFLSGEFANAPIWTTKHTINKLTAFNNDFIHLTSFIREQEGVGRYLWAPLNAGSSVQVQDAYNTNYYYSGVSPLLFLTGKNDYSGLSSFDAFSDELKKYLYAKDYENAGYFYQRFNVKYIIVDKSRSEEFSTSYLCGEGLCERQNQQYLDTILGEKVKDFGKRYSLYKINKKFANQLIYTTSDINNFTQSKENNVAFHKLSNTTYQITLRNIKNDFALVLLSPYYANWEVRTADNKQRVIGGQHANPFEYANGWIVKVSDLKQKLSPKNYIVNKDGSITVKLTLYFNLGSAYIIGLCLSCIVAIASLVYVLYMVRKDWIRKNT